MLKRCYYKESLIKNSSYKGCTVAEEWHNFGNFAKWFEEKYNWSYMSDWSLDKDILVRGNKIYSPETCCFVPQEVNTLFINCKKSRGKYPIGVCYHKASKKFTAYLNKQSYSELFNTPEEAFQAYKIEKEKYIKEVADKWKDLIDPNVYEALYNWKIEITD